MVNRALHEVCMVLRAPCMLSSHATATQRHARTDLFVRERQCDTVHIRARPVEQVQWAIAQWRGRPILGSDELVSSDHGLHARYQKNKILLRPAGFHAIAHIMQSGFHTLHYLRHGR